MAACAAAAQQLLLELCSNPAHGMASAAEGEPDAGRRGMACQELTSARACTGSTPCLHWAGAAPQAFADSNSWSVRLRGCALHVHMSDAAVAAMTESLIASVRPSLLPGDRRLQRFLQGLKPTSSAAHYDLLLAVTAAQPALAAAYLGAAQLPLEPRPALRWWAGMSLIGRLVQQASALQPPFLEQARRWRTSSGQEHDMESRSCGCITAFNNREGPCIQIITAFSTVAP